MTSTLNELARTSAGVRRFVNERLIPLEAKVSEDDAIPADALAEMRALGCSGFRSRRSTAGLASRWRKSAARCSSSVAARRRSARPSAPMSASAAKGS